NIDQKYHLIVFSAEWCGDCVAYVPGLAKSLAIAKNDMVQARVVDYDNHRDMADEMNIRKIPTIIVYDKNWKEIGSFVESPRKPIPSQLLSTVEVYSNQQASVVVRVPDAVLDLSETIRPPQSPVFSKAPVVLERALLDEAPLLESYPVLGF